jgi:dienelactone hydrolase
MTPTDEVVPAGWPAEQVRLTAATRGRVAARVALTLREFDPEVELTRVGDQFPGAVLARLPGAGKRPAIIVLGGSEGGDFTARMMSPRLASHGYAVLGLPYCVQGNPPRADLRGLPTAFVDIPVDRLERARAWLQRQPGVDGERIAVWGVSKGAELALLAATRFDWITAVVAIAPSDVVWEGFGAPGQKPGSRASFAWRGEPLAFVPHAGLDAALAVMGTGGRAQLRPPHDRGRAEHPDAVVRARIPVERYRGALLVAGGDDDQIWASGAMAGNIARARAGAGLRTTALVFGDAGHALSGHGWSPTTTLDRAPLVLGGTPAGNARAQAEVWRAALAFLAGALAPDRTARAPGAPAPPGDRWRRYIVP